MLRQYNELYDFLRTPFLPTQSEPAVAFGRNDKKVAQALGDLIIPDLVTIAVITGGIGKDSGDLLKRGFRSEADFIDTELTKDARSRSYPIPPILLEKKAKNGGENARLSLDILTSIGIAINSLTAVAHATSAQRLARTMALYTSQRTNGIATVHVKPTSYNFDPANPLDQEEALSEFNRLITWPQKGWLKDYGDLPPNLVDFVIDTMQTKL